MASSPPPSRRLRSRFLSSPPYTTTRCATCIAAYCTSRHSFVARSQMFTRYPLLAAYSSLPAPRCPLLATHCSLPTARHPLLATPDQQVPLVSYWASSTALSASRFPVFARTFPADSAAAGALLRVMHGFGWRNFGTLHADDEYANSYEAGLRHGAPAAGMRAVVSASFTERSSTSMALALEQVRLSGVNILVAIMHAYDAHSWVKQSHAAGLLADGYVWFTTDSLHFTDVPASNISSGILNFFPSAEDTAGFARLLSRWTERREDDCTNELFNLSHFPEVREAALRPINGYLYDAVIALGVATALRRRQNATIDKEFGPAAFELLVNLTFEGASGHVAFEANGDRQAADAPYTLANFQLVDGATFEADSGTVDGCSAVEGEGCGDDLVTRRRRLHAQRTAPRADQPGYGGEDRRRLQASGLQLLAERVGVFTEASGLNLSGLPIQWPGASGRSTPPADQLLIAAENDRTSAFDDLVRQTYLVPSGLLLGSLPFAYFVKTRMHASAGQVAGLLFGFLDWGTDIGFILQVKHLLRTLRSHVRWLTRVAHAHAHTHTHVDRLRPTGATR